MHTDDSIGVAPAARLSADWGLAGGVAPRWRGELLLTSLQTECCVVGLPIAVYMQARGKVPGLFHCGLVCYHWLDAYFVVMLCFKFVYAVLCGILRYLLFVVSS